jgi:hypothetical protein
MQPYPVETRSGATIIQLFPRNVYWNQGCARDVAGGSCRQSPHQLPAGQRGAA